MTNKTKAILTSILIATSTTLLRAGGLMTNTNYHIAFDRMMARGATFDIDAIYSNPAGLAWGHEGWQLSFNWQMPTQDRDITTSIPGFLGSDYHHKYKGKASAPFVPGLFAAYRHDRWTVSAMLGIVGSGGYVKYDEGVPMFNIPISAMLAQSLLGMGLTPQAADPTLGLYTLDSQMKGKQYIYGGRMNFTYRLTDHVAAAVGLQANYYDGYYQGHVVADMNGLKLVNLQLDCDQKGWGFTPLVSLDYHQGPLTLAARYEFRTKIRTTNKTHELTADIYGKTPQEVNALLGEKVAPYQDGAKTRYDMPALLSLAAGYEFTPALRAMVEYHFFDDKHAKMANNRQKELTHGTHEVLVGAEYDINKTFTVSAGAQRTDYGLSDDYQQNTSFACDSYSVGLGGAVNLSSKVRLNVSYFWTMYSDYEKHVPAGNPGYCGTGLEGTDVYSRTNGVFGIGVDYKF